MPRYTYTAQDDDDVLKKGALDAAGKRQAARAVVRKHWPSLRAARIKWKLYLLGDSLVSLHWTDSGATGFVRVQLHKLGPAA